jgi:putative acetyltransferase
MALVVRRERSGEVEAVAAVHRAAFLVQGAGDPPEVGLVAALRRSGAWVPALSLVAVADEAVVGHVVCTRGWVEPGSRPVLGLGPLGVDPHHQGRGVGSALVHAVLAVAEALEEPLVALLGDPAYYARFGFVPAHRSGVEAPDPTWADHFQVRPLGDLPTPRGSFRYAAAFDDL